MFFCPSIYICAMCYFGCFAKPQILNRDLSCYCAFGFFFLFWDSDYVIFVMVQSVMCDLRHFKLLINFCRWRSNIMKRYTMKFFLAFTHMHNMVQILETASLCLQGQGCVHLPSPLFFFRFYLNYLCISPL